MIQKTIQTPNRGEVSISGSYTVDGAGVVSALVGTGFRVVKEAAAGTWTVHLLEPVQRFISVQAGGVLAAADDLIVNVGTPVLVDPVTGLPTFQIFFWDVSGGGVANKAGQVHFEAIVSKVL